MDIKKHVTFDRHSGKVYGFVDLGNGPLDDPLQPHATKALVLIAVSIIGHWKLPLAYLFTDSTNAQLQATLIESVITQLYQSGCVAVSLTFDGLAANLKTVQFLGGNLDIEKFFSRFPHPCISGFYVSVVLDTCHMMKLFRNLLDEYQQILVPNFGLAQWKHVENLNAKQQDEGLTLGNKLSIRHINYKLQKMKVRLAVQLLSSSVSRALKFLRLSGVTQFSDTLPTEILLSTVDKLFDILNSRSIKCKGYKQPVTIYNADFIKEQLSVCRDFLINLRDCSGNLIVKSRKRTCIVGFCSAIDAVIYLTDHVLLHNIACNVHFSYLLTHRLSQDHIETFFSVVRRRGGWNNNPSAFEFVHIYRALLSNLQVLPSSNGNVSLLTDEVSDDSRNDYNLFDSNLTANLQCSQLPALSDYVENVSEYIAGFVVKRLLSRLKCNDCRFLLISDEPTSNGAFLEYRDKGGLVKPSGDVVYIIHTAEKVFRTMINTHNKPVHSISRLRNELEKIAFEKLDFGRLFVGSEHFFETYDNLDNHIFSLIRLVIKFYTDIRKFHLIKNYSYQMHSQILRQKFSKLVLFQNQ